MDDLNRFLAEKVLGWTYDDKRDWWRTHEGGVRQGFDPRRSLFHCEPLLDKIEQDGWDWSCLGSGEARWTEFSMWRNENNKDPIEVMAATRTEALCRAIARAYGWKGE